jgi:dihydroxyacid dehydratase/phosphogluconate dehydratase
MREMLYPSNALMGAGLGDHVALVTDGRFSGIIIILSFFLFTTLPSYPSVLAYLYPRASSVRFCVAYSFPFLTHSILSGATHGIMIGHVTPESYVGGPLAIVKV